MKIKLEIIKKLFCVLCVTLFMCGTSFNVFAESNIPEEEIKTMMEELVFPMTGVTGMVIGVISGDDTFILGLGETVKDNGVKPNGQTVWQIGSASKVFTTNIFAAMVVEGKIKLTDPIRNYIPEDVKVPSYEGRQITLLDLATHTSGFPRSIESEDLKSDLSGGYQKNPYYTAKEFYPWLNNYKLEVKPGTRYLYSNVGFALLGDILARREGITYGELVDKYIANRYGLKDTTVSPNKKQKMREAASYWMNGDLVQNDWVFKFEQPSGGIYSTADDLTKFVRLNLGLIDEHYYPVTDIAHGVYVQRTELVNPYSFGLSGMALGWEVDYSHNALPVTFSKNGWVSGFNTWIFLVPSEKMGIFSISNKPCIFVDEELKNILRSTIGAKRKQSK